MRQKTAFEFQVGDVVRLIYHPKRGVFRVAQQIHWKDDPDNYCVLVTNLDGSNAAQNLGEPADCISNECNFELDPFLSAVFRVRHPKTQTTENKRGAE